MRIVSSFHDYYDGPATMFGQEPLFIRDTNLPKEMYPKAQMFVIDSSYKESTYEAIIVFCGQIYELIYKYKMGTGKVLLTGRVPTDEHARLCIKYSLERYPDMLDQPIWTVNWSHPRVISDKYPAVIINPVLRDYEFEKVVDPYTAAQEIDMFLSNLAVRPDKEPDKIDDKTKIISHGFDVKKSFRKDKQ